MIAYEPTAEDTIDSLMVFLERARDNYRDSKTKLHSELWRCKIIWILSVLRLLSDSPGLEVLLIPGHHEMIVFRSSDPPFILKNEFYGSSLSISVS